MVIHPGGVPEFLSVFRDGPVGSHYPFLIGSEIVHDIIGSHSIEGTEGKGYQTDVNTKR